MHQSSNKFGSIQSSHILYTCGMPHSWSRIIHAHCHHKVEITNSEGKCTLKVESSCTIAIFFLTFHKQ